MVSVTASLGYDPAMALMAPLSSQCTFDSELLSVTASAIPQPTATIITHQRILIAIAFIIR
jgi:hypothetical protein